MIRKSRKSKSLFPDDNAIRVMAEPKQAEADAIPGGLKSANSKSAGPLWRKSYIWPFRANIEALGDRIRAHIPN
jgi:hypothetical protein